MSIEKRDFTKLKQRVKNAIKSGKAWGDVVRSSKSGIWIYELNHDDFSVPMCTVWFRFVGKSAIEVMDSKTHLTFRRCGVRTYTHEMMFAGYPTIDLIFSADGTKAGLAWMKKVGYTESALGWQFSRAKISV